MLYSCTRMATVGVKELTVDYQQSHYLYNVNNVTLSTTILNHYDDRTIIVRL